MIETPAYPFCIAAVDVGGTKIAAGLVRYEQPDMRPVIQGAFDIPTLAQNGGEEVVGRILAAINRLIQQADIHVAGIGVGTAGCVDPADGSIGFANDIMPGYTGQPLKQSIVDAFGLPVAVINDVQAHAFGEAAWGAARDVSSCLMVAAGTGIGGALVENGRVIGGAHGAAGHLGHTLHPAAVEMTCGCGSVAHMENLASGSGIVAEYQRVSGSDEEIDGAEIARRCSEGDQAAVQVLYTAGRVLGESIGSWVNLFDPAVVILTGSVIGAGDVWNAALMEGIDAQTLPFLKPVSLIGADLGSAAALIGAAENLRAHN